MEAMRHLVAILLVIRVLNLSSDVKTGGALLWEWYTFLNKL